MATLEEKVRLNLAMPHKTKQLIDDLQERTGSGTMSETIRRALALLDVITAKQEEGGKLFVHWPNGTQSQVHIL